MTVYHAGRPPLSQRQRIRGLEFQFYRWPSIGERPAEPQVEQPILEQPTVLLHGWGDTGETFQFVVDHLPNRSLIAFDARGFGRTQWSQDGYWFPDYLGDLDAILDWLSPDQPVDLVGHSMGGNVALLYAGIRPHRIRRVVSLEGMGMPSTSAEQAPGRYREWLDELSVGTHFATYDDFAQFEKLLERRNPRTPPAHLTFIARSWAHQRTDGRIELRADPRHKRVNPMLYQREQAEACWQAITAPVLMVIGEMSEFVERLPSLTASAGFATLFRDISVATIAGAGHMMHHERPGEIAELIERALR